MFVCGQCVRNQHLWRQNGDMNLSKDINILLLMGKVTCGINRVRCIQEFFSRSLAICAGGHQS